MKHEGKFRFGCTTLFLFRFRQALNTAIIDYCLL